MSVVVTLGWLLCLSLDIHRKIVSYFDENEDEEGNDDWTLVHVSLSWKPSWGFILFFNCNRSPSSPPPPLPSPPPLMLPFWILCLGVGWTKHLIYSLFFFSFFFSLSLSWNDGIAFLSFLQYGSWWLGNYWGVTKRFMRSLPFRGSKSRSLSRIENDRIKFQIVSFLSRKFILYLLGASYNKSHQHGLLSRKMIELFFEYPCRKRVVVKLSLIIIASW